VKKVLLDKTQNLFRILNTSIISPLRSLDVMFKSSWSGSLVVAFSSSGQVVQGSNPGGDVRLGPRTHQRLRTHIAGRAKLRSAHHGELIVPPMSTKTFGSRSFRSASPTVWNRPVSTSSVISACWRLMHHDVKIRGARIRNHDLWIRKRVCYPLHHSAPQSSYHHIRYVKLSYVSWGQFASRLKTWLFSGTYA